MQTAFTWLVVIAQGVAAGLWLVSTLVKVTGKDAENAYQREMGVTSGGPAQIILDYGDGADGIDFVQTAARQAIFKIGQFPSLATIASAGTKRFRKVLDKSFLNDLNRAIGLFAHGVGAGSFVYLRRIFEHLLIETAKAARSDGNVLEGFEGLHMDEKIKALGTYLRKRCDPHRGEGDVDGLLPFVTN